MFMDPNEVFLISASKPDNNDQFSFCIPGPKIQSYQPSYLMANKKVLEIKKNISQSILMPRAT